MSPEKPTGVKPPPPTIKDFETWVAGRTGLSRLEFLKVWASAFDLTLPELKPIKDQISREEAKERAAEEAILKRAQEEKKKKEEKARAEEAARVKAEAAKKVPTVKPELVIERIPYPKWWKDSGNSKIDLTAPGSQVLATVTGNLRLFVATIVLTVTGETQITIHFGNAGTSGPIYLGGENQPMGIVIAMGNSPAPCGNGNLVITATDPGAANPSVGGWATCFVEEVIKQKV